MPNLSIPERIGFAVRAFNQSVERVPQMHTQNVTFSFNGSLQYEERRERQDRDHEPPPTHFQRQRFALARAIEQDLSQHLPFGQYISVQIEFKEGSLIWLGTATFFGGLATVSGTIQFFEYASKIISAAVDRAILSHDFEFGYHYRVTGHQETHVTLNQPANPPRDPGAADVTTTAPSHRMHWALTIVNTVLVALLTALAVFYIGYLSAKA
jgi:hypothetical protein